jgi:hypothetical protein
MRIARALVCAVFMAGTSCMTQTEPLEAGPDQFSPPCTTNADCASGLSCSYEILVGCGAKGECREFIESGECTAATTACGCDGKVVQVPACWMGFAPAPVLRDESPCND